MTQSLAYCAGRSGGIPCSPRPGLVRLDQPLPLWGLSFPSLLGSARVSPSPEGEGKGGAPPRPPQCYLLLIRDKSLPLAGLTLQASL